MSRETISGAYHQQQHVWGDAPPGQGRQRTCTKCGSRETDLARETACLGGQVREAVLNGGGQRDYDPFDE